MGFASRRREIVRIGAPSRANSGVMVDTSPPMSMPLNYGTPSPVTTSVVSTSTSRA